MGWDFRPLRPAEQKRLRTALEKNVEDNTYIRFDPKDTSFAGMAENVSDEEVVNAIRSIPCHYGVMLDTVGG